jgi:hypothetical protein
MKRLILILICAIITVSLFLPVHVLAAADWEWQVPFESTGLHGIWGSSAKDVYAVGVGILHYNGTTWSPINIVTSEDLLAVSGSSARNVWAVGHNGAVFHYNGAHWRKINCGSSEQLNDVWVFSEHDVYVIGSGGLLLHYNGINWKQINCGTQKDLHSIWASSPHDIFLSANPSPGAIMHFDGKSWRSMDYPEGNGISGLWGFSPTNVFASGQGVLLHYNGNSWTKMYTPDGGRYHTVWGSSPRDLWAGGDDGKIYHYNGTGWTLKNSGVNTSSTQCNIWKIWGCSASQVWAVTAGVLHFIGNQHHEVPGPKPHTTVVQGDELPPLTPLDGAYIKGVIFGCTTEGVFNSDYGLHYGPWGPYFQTPGISAWGKPTVSMKFDVPTTVVEFSFANVNLETGPVTVANVTLLGPSGKIIQVSQLTVSAPFEQVGVTRFVYSGQAVKQVIIEKFYPYPCWIDNITYFSHPK